MYAPDFAYYRAGSLAEAGQLLQQHPEHVGHSARARVANELGASVHTAHPRKSLGIYMGAHPGRNGHPGRAHCCPRGPCAAHGQGRPWGTGCSKLDHHSPPMGVTQAC